MIYYDSKRLKEAINNIISAIENGENKESVEHYLRVAIYKIFHGSDVFIYNELDQEINIALCDFNFYTKEFTEENKKKKLLEAKNEFIKAKSYIDEYLKSIDNKLEEIENKPKKFVFNSTLSDGIITSNMFRED